MLPWGRRLFCRSPRQLTLLQVDILRIASIQIVCSWNPFNVLHVNFNRGLIWGLIWAFFWAIWDLIWQKFCGCDLIWDLICLSLLAGGLIWDLIWWMFEQPDLICGLIWQVFWHCDLIWGLIWKIFKPLIWFEVWFDFQKAGLPIPSACAADRRSCYAMVPRQLLRIASELAPLSLSLFGFVFGVTLAPRFRVSNSHHG